MPDTLKKILLLIGYIFIVLYMGLVLGFLVLLVQIPQTAWVEFQHPAPQTSFVDPQPPLMATATDVLFVESIPTVTEIAVTPESQPELGWNIEENPADQHLNIEALEELMLELINDARRDSGLNPVAWDAFAASVGELHAQDMSDHQYFSHWNLSGFGPDHRYVQAGGSEVAMENLSTYWYRYEDGSPAEIDDFGEVVRNAQIGLMNSPGHRRNILDPDHTHVGVGFAYNADTGDFKLAQIFINRYIRLDPLARVASPGDLIEISGELLLGSTNPMLNIAFEPVPQPMSVAELDLTEAYGSAAQFLAAYQPVAADGNRFTFNANLGNTPGLYHVRIWVNHATREIHAVNWIIEVK